MSMRAHLASALVMTLAAMPGAEARPLQTTEAGPKATPNAPIEPAQAAPRSTEPPAKPAEPVATPAQQSPKPAQSTSTAQSVTSKTDALVEPAGFTYNPEGRRDPFLSLIRRGVDPRGTNQLARPGGLAGLSVAEVTLRGTVRSREGFVAILQGADQRAYIVRPGDKLFDGTVRAVSQSDVVLLEQVSDPLSLEKQREVRKVLRQPEAN